MANSFALSHTSPIPEIVFGVSSGSFPGKEHAVPSIEQKQLNNWLLRALPESVFNELKPSLTSVELPLKHVLVETDLPTCNMCFIESGLASVVATSADNENIEVGHIGREGVSGTHLLLKADTTPTRTFMQVAGKGLMVPASELMAILDVHSEARDIFMRYIHCSELQLASSALANTRYSINERLARWLLMSHDRLEGDDLALTHDFLALMLGVRRSGVTTEIHILEGIHAIRATRGHVLVLDRAKLEEIAGGSYGIPEKEYDRLIGRFSS
jgi:CRP-like cAMP-binding protein